jgi:hypothetical protein
MDNWWQEETRTADLGDARLNGRFSLLLGALGQKPQLSIPAACGGWGETLAAYRFFDNDKVDFGQILKCHRDATLARMEGAEVVLLVQDTTHDDENVVLGAKGLGTLKNTAKTEACLHPTLAFTPQKICLGVVHAAYWQRLEKSPRQERRDKGADEKESAKWLESYQESCALQAQFPDKLLVNISDREADIYELFVDYHEHGKPCQFIVRAAQNRRLAGDQAKLFETLAAAPGLGDIQVEVAARPGRPARVAVLSVKARTVTLKAPQRKGYKLPEVRVNAVLVQEIAPPADKDALEWLLLTTLPVATYGQAVTVVDWYGVRWCIEVYFHVLKSGCQIEKLQLETQERYLPCLALYMIIAWRVLFALMLGRHCPELDAGIVFSKAEWQALYVVVKRAPPPDAPPKLGEIMVMVASLGGYLARKNDPPPGPKTLWTGLQRLRDFVLSLEAYQTAFGTCV